VIIFSKRVVAFEFFQTVDVVHDGVQVILHFADFDIASLVELDVLHVERLPYTYSFTRHSVVEGVALPLPLSRGESGILVVVLTELRVGLNMVTDFVADAPLNIEGGHAVRHNLAVRVGVNDHLFTVCTHFTLGLEPLGPMRVHVNVQTLEVLPRLLQRLEDLVELRITGRIGVMRGQVGFGWTQIGAGVVC